MKSSTAITDSYPGPLDVQVPRENPSGWTSFWFTPAAPVGLHALRILAGVLFIAWLLPLSGHVEAFFGMKGWFDREAYLTRYRLAQEAEKSRERLANATPEDATALNEAPPEIPLWSVLYMIGSSTAMVYAVFWGAIGVFALFTLGIAVRITALLTFVLVASFLATPAIAFDGDDLLVIPAFYLLIGYLLLGQWSRNLTPAERLLGPRGTSLVSWLLGKRGEGEGESYAANLAVRLFQVHFAIVVVVSGLHKLQFGTWWGGVALWFPLHRPFETTAAEFPMRNGDSYLFMLTLAQYLVLAWQIGFPLFAWKRRWRPLLIGGALVGWYGSSVLYRLPVFGPVYVLGCLSYLTPQEWSWITGKLAQAWERLAGKAALPEKKLKVPSRALP